MNTRPLDARGEDTDGDAPVLFEFSTCPRSRSVQAVLRYKHVPVRHREVPILGRWALRRLSGQTWPPVLLHHDRVIVGTEPIIRHLDAVFPDPRLLPSAPDALAECLRISQWIDANVHFLIVALKYLNPHNRTVAIASVRRNYRDRYNRGLAALVPLGQHVRLARLGYFRWQLPALAGRLRACCEVLDARARRGRFMVGDELSSADVRVFAVLALLTDCVEAAELEAHPALLRWFRRIEAEHAWVRG